MEVKRVSAKADPSSTDMAQEGAASTCTSETSIGQVGEKHECVQTLQPSSLNTKDKWAAALEAQQANARKRRVKWPGKGDKGTSELDHLGEQKRLK